MLWMHFLNVNCMTLFTFSEDCFSQCIQHLNTRCPKKIYPNLMLNFEAATTLMLRILVFSVFPDLYISFDTSLICFHGLMSKLY